MQGKVLSIYIAESANSRLTSLASAELHAGKGIVGDRYYTGNGTFSELLADNPAKEITLIEIEEITAFNCREDLNFKEEDFRRNIICSNIRLNNLVGKRFFIGDTELYGIKLCEPCSHLAKILSPRIIPGLIGKAGLRAAIKTNGSIMTGNHIFTHKDDNI